MSMDINWMEQALSEVTCAVQEDDDKIVATVVWSLIDFMYALEYEAAVDEDVAELHALGVLPQEWHLIIKEAARIKRGYLNSSLFDTREQRSEAAGAFAAYIIHYYEEQYGLFS